jgi:hypothetical protein
MHFSQQIQSIIPPSMNRLFQRIGLALVAIALTACAHIQPTAVELSAQADRKLVLMVEEPHRF